LDKITDTRYSKNVGKKTKEREKAQEANYEERMKKRNKGRKERTRRDGNNRRTWGKNEILYIIQYC